MKIGMIGFGQMGQAIKAIGLTRGHEFVTIDPHNDQADHADINQDTLSAVDVCIDFTSPEVVLENISKVVRCGKSLVVGTTGWLDSYADVKELVASNGVGFVYAANFSFGVNIFYQIVQRAAEIMNRFDEYDVAGIEYHHSRKKDSPSGTAAHLAELLVGSIDRKDTPVFAAVNRRIESNELQFNSIRCGSYPGVHSVLFDSNDDTIELTHSARNRAGFALGAVRSAEWLQDKVGLFTIDDIMRDIAQI